MYRPSAFAIDDKETLRVFLRANPFATLAAVLEGEVQFAYAPVVAGDDGALRLHLARNNPLAGLADGARVRLSFLGANAYVSPDWYQSAGMVPTWNYSAVEGAGVVRRLNEAELRQLLIDLSAAEEQQLAPKKPWTIEKVPQARMAVLLGAITGIEVRLQTLEGKFKLSQNIKPEDFAGARRGLENRGDAQSLAVTRAMAQARP